MGVCVYVLSAVFFSAVQSGLQPVEKVMVESLALINVLEHEEVGSDRIQAFSVLS